MKLIFFLLIPLIIWSCQPIETGSRLIIDQKSNLILSLDKPEASDWQWLNPPNNYVFENQSLFIETKAETDYFNNPEDDSVVGTAPFLYQNIEGNFVATALVQPDFSDQWNAIALMVHQDSLNWIKFAFEKSDATGKSIVSVVTKGVSDDANGVTLPDQDQIWLRVIKRDNLYALHWSKDGKNYQMARLATLPDQTSIKIGLEVQSPLDQPAKHQILYFGLEKRTIKDLRKGV